MDGFDPANWPVDKTYAIEWVGIYSGPRHWPEIWRRAPVLGRKPGPFWTLHTLHLPRVAFLKKCKAWHFTYTFGKDGEVDITDPRAVKLGPSAVYFSKEGYIKSAWP